MSLNRCRHRCESGFQVQVMQATAKEMKTQFKSKELNIDAIDKMADEMASD